MDQRPDPKPGAHHEAWALIPWVVNGSASDTERYTLQAHLSGCEDCRLELARQQTLRAAIAAGPAAAGDVETGLERLRSRLRSRLWSRLDSPLNDAAGGAGAPGRERRRMSAAVRWLAAALAVESLALVALGVALLPRAETPADYVTLGTHTAARNATIRIVPAPSLRLDDLQRLLHTLRLQIVAGPSSVGAYDLAPLAGAPSRELQIATLRADPGLRLVEPLDGPRGAR
jgi:hypothetical protein